MWLACGARRRTRVATEAEGVAREVETLGADCRGDARIVVGRLLRFGGADWRIRAASPDPQRPGRLALETERVR